MPNISFAAPALPNEPKQPRDIPSPVQSDAFPAEKMQGKRDTSQGSVPFRLLHLGMVT